MPIGVYDDIVEVQMVPAQVANDYMDAGYVLLGIHPITNVRVNDGDGSRYVSHGVTFVVGRDNSTSKLPRTNANRTPTV